MPRKIKFFSLQRNLDYWHGFITFNQKVVSSSRHRLTYKIKFTTHEHAYNFVKDLNISPAIRYNTKFHFVKVHDIANPQNHINPNYLRGLFDTFDITLNDTHLIIKSRHLSNWRNEFQIWFDIALPKSVIIKQYHHEMKLSHKKAIEMLKLLTCEQTQPINPSNPAWQLINTAT